MQRETMFELLSRLTEKKQKLDSFGPLPAALLSNLAAWHRIALTYSSNALEGNTLSMQETACVVEEGLSVAGKTVVEHLEAIGHAQAINFIQGLAQKKKE
jgi:Fic family protein